MVEIVKRRVESWYISGPALREQRLAAGLSLRALCDLLKASTGSDYIVINKTITQLSKMTIWRMENKMKEIELDPETAVIIQKIFEM